jgi:hypothetical protein
MTAGPPPQDPLVVLKTLLAAVDAKADFYALLQIPRNAEPMQIRDAYFRLAKLVHPDQPQFSGNVQLRAQATRAFQSITAANATLGDPLKRSAYMHQMMQAAMERSEAVAAQMQSGVRPTQTASGLRPTGPQPHAIDIVPPRPQGFQTPRAMSTTQTPAARGPISQTSLNQVSAPGSVNRPMVNNQGRVTGQNAVGSTGQNAVGSTGQNAVGSTGQNAVGSTGQFQRAPSSTGTFPSQTPIGATGQFQRPTTPMGGTGQFPRATPAGQSAVGPVTKPSTQAQSGPTLRGLEPPPNAEVARIYLHSGRQQLNRRDWAGAQEALELAFPLLEKNEAADCKVMLGWSIFNNHANAEADRIERPKAMWNEVAVQFAKTPFHAQAAYYLAVWHKLHGELRHVMSNLQVCLELQPNHIEAAREKRLLEQRRSNLAEMQELEHREKQVKDRRTSKSAIPTGKPTPAASLVGAKKVALQKEPSWLEKLFGGDKK